MDNSPTSSKDGTGFRSVANKISKRIDINQIRENHPSLTQLKKNKLIPNCEEI